MFHGALGLVAIVGLNAALAALATRFFRVRMRTTWGSLAYALLLTPLAMVAVLFVVSGVLGLGADLGSEGAVLFLTVLVPLGVGVAFDYLWMPAPDEVEPPDEV